MKKTLFITCSRIGDAVLTTGILDYIHNHIPNARVTIAVDPLPAPLFRDYPLVDSLLIFAKQKYSRHWLALWKQVKGQYWDWVIDLRGSILSYALRCGRRSVWHQKENDHRHKVDQLSSLVGIPVTAPALWFDHHRLKIAEKLLTEENFYLAIAPVANWVGKQWPLERFTIIAKQFCQLYPHAKIVLITAPHEQPLVQPFIKNLPSSQLINLMDYGYDLGQTAACLQRCQLFLGNDSGLMHIAAAVGIPTIGLFGPSREEIYGPYDSHFSKTGKKSNTVVRIPQTYDQLKAMPHFSHQSQDCYMTDLTIDTVWHVLRQHLEKNPLWYTHIDDKS